MVLEKSATPRAIPKVNISALVLQGYQPTIPVKPYKPVQVLNDEHASKVSVNGAGKLVSIIFFIAYQ